MIDALLSILLGAAESGSDQYVQGFLLGTILYREHPELCPLIHQRLMEDDTNDSMPTVVAVINAALEVARRTER